MSLRRILSIVSLISTNLQAYPDFHSIQDLSSSRDNLHYNTAGYEYEPPINPREDPYSGVDSYGVPVDDVVLTTQPPDYYSYPTATGTGYGPPTLYSPPTPEVQASPEPGITKSAVMLGFVLAVLFLWPVTVTVPASSASQRVLQAMDTGLPTECTDKILCAVEQLDADSVSLNP